MGPTTSSGWETDLVRAYNILEHQGRRVDFVQSCVMLKGLGGGGWILVRRKTMILSIGLLDILSPFINLFYKSQYENPEYQDLASSHI